MKNILNLNELLSLDGNLTTTKNHFVINSIAILIGIAGVSIGTQIDAPDYLQYTLAVGGVIIAIIALGNLFTQPDTIANNKTHETLHKHKLFFHASDEHFVKDVIAQGKINDLLDRSCEHGPIQAIIYSTANKQYYIAQLFKFVPYEYQPYSDPVIFSKP